MATKMDSYIVQLKNLIWKGRYKLKGVPWWRDFLVAPTPEMAQTVGGKFGGLFFEHDGDVVNKWLHYLSSHIRCPCPSIRWFGCSDA